MRSRTEIRVLAAGSSGDSGDASIMDADAVAAALAVDVETSLSAQEAARRLARDGPSELRAAPRPGGVYWRSSRAL